MCSLKCPGDCLNVHTSAFCGSFSTTAHLDDLLLFQVAFSLAESGLLIFCLSQKPLETLPSEFLELGYTKKPEVLERIHFRYLNSAKEMIAWCHRLHSFVRRPNAILVKGLNDFISLTSDVSSYRLCSALVDAINYSSYSLSARPSYLVVTVSSPIETLSVQLSTQFFDNVWHVDRDTNASLHFTEVKKHPFQNKFLKVKFKTLSGIREFDPMSYLSKKKQSS